MAYAEWEANGVENLISDANRQRPFIFFHWSACVASYDVVDVNNQSIHCVQGIRIQKPMRHVLPLAAISLEGEPSELRVPRAPYS